MSFLSRRAFLSTLGAAGASLPLAQFMRRTEVRAADGYPMRFIVMFSPHGTWRDTWLPRLAPDGANITTDFTLNFENSILSPLERHKDKLVIFDKATYRAVTDGGEQGHKAGPATFLTGSQLIDGAYPADEASSLDQYLKDRLAAKWLGMSVYNKGGESVYDSISFRSKANFATRRVADFQNNPLQIYGKVFAERIAGSEKADEAMVRLASRRETVLNYARDEIKRMESNLTGQERQKFQRHLNALETVESTLTRTQVCQDPGRPGDTLDPTNINHVPDISSAHIKMLAEAIACNLTQVAVLQYFQANGRQPMPWININVNPHEGIGHQITDTRGGLIEQLSRINRWFAEQLAMLIDALDAIPEGGGTALDHTVILWGNEMGNPNAHASHNVPLVMAGGTQGPLQTGRFHTLQNFSHLCEYGSDAGSLHNKPRSYTNQPYCQGEHEPIFPHNKILTSICQAMGLSDVDYFGSDRYKDNPDYRGTVPGLLKG